MKLGITAFIGFIILLTLMFWIPANSNLFWKDGKVCITHWGYFKKPVTKCSEIKEQL